MVSKDFISLVNELSKWIKEELPVALHRLWKKYAEDFFKGVSLGDTKKVDKEGREILAYFESLKAPASSDKKYERPSPTPPKKK